MNADRILGTCEDEGYVFVVKRSPKCIVVRCALPDGNVRYIIFDDHRIDNPHGGKPHVCNQWHKALGVPLAYTIGEDVTDQNLLKRVLLAASVMCITQSAAYAEMKEQLFS